MTSYQCACMDGPNGPDPACLYCGGTGEYVSDARLSELCGHYSYLTEYNDGHGRKDFGPSDRQHVAILKALQIARATLSPAVKEPK